MKKIEEDTNYVEGMRIGKSLLRFIENTVYGTLEEAIRVKTELVEKFEETFSYTKEINDNETFDKNYSYNMGMLRAFKKGLGDEQS